MLILHQLVARYSRMLIVNKDTDLQEGQIILRLGKTHKGPHPVLTAESTIWSYTP